MTSSEVTASSLEVIKAHIKLTKEKWGWEHFGVVGAFPAAVLKLWGQSEDVVLRWEKVKDRNEGSVSHNEHG